MIWVFSIKNRRWKIGFPFPGICVLLAVFILSVNFFAQSIKQTTRADLDFDGKSEEIILDGGQEKTLQIRRGNKILWQGVPRHWKPWKLAIADVDGDGNREIIVGVFKATKFFRKPHNCLFIYGFSSERAYPKWLGSSLSQPFSDFIFVESDCENGVELIALETALDGKMSFGVYRWNGFGFTLERRRGDWLSARILDSENGNFLIQADGKEFLLRYF